MLYDLDFWKASLERSLKAFAQTLAAAFASDQLIGVLSIDWTQALSLAVSAAVLSILTSVGSAKFGKNAGPSLAVESTKPRTVIVEVAKPTAGKKTPVARKKPPVTKK